MIARALAPILVLVCAAAAQETPRSKASDYPVHAKLPALEIGAEYLLHSIPVEKGLYVAKEFLVVEVILVPTDKDGAVPSGQFALRVNGKTMLHRSSPGEITASIKYPDWEQRPTLSAGADIGDANVGIGPRQVGRFPGDQRRLPPAPRVPEPADPSGTPKQAEKPLEMQISEAGLPEAPSGGPVKGCLFFAFQGKTKSIRSLELIYDGGDSATRATLKLF